MGFLDKVLGDLMRDHGGRNARRLLRKVGGKKLLLAGGVMAADALINPSTGAPRGSGYGFTKGGAEARSTTEPPAVPPAGMPPVTGVAAGPGLPRGTAQPLSGSAGESPAGRPPAAPPGAVPPPAGVAAEAEAGTGNGAAAAVPPPPPPPPVAEPGAEASEEVAGDDLSLPSGLTFAAVRTMIAAALSDGHLDPEERTAVERRLEDAELAPEEVARIHKDLVLPASVRELAAMTTVPGERELLYQFAAAVVAADGQMLAPERDWLRGLGVAFEIDEARARELESDVLAELREAGDAPD